MIIFMKSYEIMTSYQATKILPNVSMPSAEESSDPHLPHWSPWSQWPTPTLEELIFGTFEELLFGLLGGTSTQEFNFCVFVRVSLSRLFVFCLVDFFARWVPITWFVAFFNGLADFTCISVRFLPNRISFFEGMCCFYLLSMPIPWRNKDS